MSTSKASNRNLHGRESWITLTKIIFAFYFVLMLILYAFVDDGGLATKGFYDFLFMPVPSLLFAGVFTLLTCLMLYVGFQVLNFFSSVFNSKN